MSYDVVGMEVKPGDKVNVRCILKEIKPGDIAVLETYYRKPPDFVESGTFEMSLKQVVKED